MCKTHGEGNLARIRRNPCSRFFFGKQEHEAGEVFGIVLDALGKNHTVIMFGGAPSGDGGARFVSASERFPHAAGGVFGGDAPPFGGGGGKKLAPCKGPGGGRDRP